MTNFTKRALLAAALIAAPLAQASADTTPGWYAGLGGGVAFQDSTGSTGANPKLKFTQGYDVLGNGGYAWDNGLRLEGEAFHSNSVVHHNDGSLGNTDAFANALYDINMGWMVTPYVGAGVGVAYVDGDNLASAGGSHVNDDSVKFAYQGIAGVSAAVDQNWSVTADYRYIASLDPRFSTSAGGKDRIDNASHNVILGVRYSFDAPAPMAPMTTSAPRMQPKAMAPKSAVAPVPQTFQVFFDFNKSDLTPEAKRIIASAAQEYKGGKYVRIAVTGHTDTKGTAKYNKALSERRAAAVKAEFATLGIDANVVTAKGVGKDGLLVPTSDGVREAQNRRAEIVLGKK